MLFFLYTSIVRCLHIYYCICNVLHPPILEARRTEIKYKNKNKEKQKHFIFTISAVNVRLFNIHGKCGSFIVHDNARSRFYPETGNRALIDFGGFVTQSVRDFHLPGRNLSAKS